MTLRTSILALAFAACAPGGTSDDGDPTDAGDACLDGGWTEPLPPSDADISGPIAAFNRNDPETFILDVLELRYPVGRALVEGGLPRCLTAFGYDLSTPAKVLSQMSTITHECGHFTDNELSGFSSNAYLITEDVTLEAAFGDTTTRGGSTFARSLIVGDAWTELNPPCGGGAGRDCDSWAGIYLDGDPNDARFESGDQGFNMLFEEMVQYVNSIATGYAFADTLGNFEVSERDGLLTFMWYVERYLYLARNEYPDAYDLLLTGDDGRWREAILTVWGRANLYLDATADIPALGINDAALLELVQDETLAGEIQRLRDAQGCR
jgi:hypothetical protein